MTNERSPEKSETKAGTAPPAGNVPGFVLKENDSFAVFVAGGDINDPDTTADGGLGQAGVYFRDTRYLSRLVLTINGLPPVLLGSSVSADNVEFRADQTNSASSGHDGEILPAKSIHVMRRRVLRDGLREALAITNHSGRPLEVDLTIDANADFRDIFEVRGLHRAKRGKLTERVFGKTDLSFGYDGLNGRSYRTTIGFSQNPEWVDGCARFVLRIEPGETGELEFSVCFDSSSSDGAATSFVTACSAAKADAVRRRGGLGAIQSSNAHFNAWIERSAADLALLISDFPTGPYPCAGIPWFSVPFGRDAIMTALQTLWLEPGIAMGVLRYLAGRQARTASPTQDSEPGKILHEARQGEMAELGEVPFGAYYGGVDTTPLFVVLAGEYFSRTQDLNGLTTLWPAIEAAIGWIDTCGDRDGDGFIEYLRGDEKGLRNQGWKDSDTAIFYPDGRLVDGGVALVEVQAYVVAAKRAAADMAAALGKTALAGDLRRQSRALAKTFDETFWDEEAGIYVIGLDADKRPLNVASSNAFHTLFVGAAPLERAVALARRSAGRDLFSGWGVRTIGRGEARYSPMAYHNGAVWPHDTTIAASGFGRYGFKAEACRLFSALFDAASGVPEYRLPELYCGFERGSEPRPIGYPGACAPQAWAAAVPYGCLAACLGLEIDAGRKAVTLHDPAMPDWLEWVRIKALGLDGSSAGLMVWRDGDSVAAEMSGLPGGYRFSLEKKSG